MFVICWYLLYEDLNELLGTQLRQELRRWASPPDPSTNHDIACGASHKQMAEWFFEGSKIKEWKSTGSLLWIHGKRTLVLPLRTGFSLSWGIFVLAGAGKSILWFVGLKLVLNLERTHFLLAPRSSKMPWSYATPDWHTLHTSTLIFGTSKSTPVTAYSSLLLTSSLHGQSPVAKYSPAFMLHTTMARTNPMTTL